LASRTAASQWRSAARSRPPKRVLESAKADGES
jgi:hypothetical protein